MNRKDREEFQRLKNRVNALEELLNCTVDRMEILEWQQKGKTFKVNPHIQRLSW